MAADCWSDAHRIAHTYDKEFKRDFWVLYAAKPHARVQNGIVAGWEVSTIRPPQGMVGVLVFKWIHADKRLEVDSELCLPYDIPISESELSKRSEDAYASIASAAKKSGSILLA